MNLQQLESTLRFRVLLVFALVHVGLVLCVVAAARLSLVEPMSATLIALIVGVALLYLGFVVGAFFLLWPILPLIRKAQEARVWWQELLGRFPEIVELVKKAIEMAKPFVQSWTDRKPAVDLKENRS